jgi:hypothetical protein
MYLGRDLLFYGDSLDVLRNRILPCERGMA